MDIFNEYYYFMFHITITEACQKMFYAAFFRRFLMKIFLFLYFISIFHIPALFLSLLPPIKYKNSIHVAKQHKFLYNQHLEMVVSMFDTIYHVQGKS